jgi:murein DD-endopeptidase MepM/ murein hydrolase activator NlpD
MSKNLIYIFIILIAAISGCATEPTVVRPPTSYQLPPLPGKLPIEGVYHRVKKGETLWRIAKTYNVELDKIIAANRLEDFTKIEVGQKILIPGVKEKKDKISEDSAFLNKRDFIWPVKGKIISFFGAKKNGITNKGIDIQAKSGAQVTAARSGKVTFIDENLKGYGKTIIVDHQDGYSTVYTNNAEILVKLGQIVAQSMPIATIGSSGRAATSCLHFEIRKRYKAENPFYYLP